MDDQNQINQPSNQGFPPIIPNVPEDITPSDTPVTTTTTTTVTSPQPISAPVAPTLPPVEVAPVAMPPIATAEPFAMPTVAPIEPEMPAKKPKNKLLPVIGGVVALLLVVGVAGASYYVSNQLSTRQAVAPNAPTSKPAASCLTNCPEGTKGNGTYQENGQTCYNCVPIGGGTPIPTTQTNYYCPGTCEPNGCGEDQCGYGYGTSCAVGDCCRPISECIVNPTTPPTVPPTAPPTISPTITPEAGACTLINVYKKNPTSGNVDLLDQTGLQNLKVGDSLTFVVMGNNANLKGRFRVTKNGAAGDWLDGSRSVIGNESVVNYSNYIVETAGTYKFEARVSLTP